jgi:hypothetical protein
MTALQVPGHRLLHLPPTTLTTDLAATFDGGDGLGEGSLILLNLQP